MAGDYFMQQYGLEKSMPAATALAKSINNNVITVKKLDRNKIMVTDIAGVKDDVPTFNYTQELEKKIERLEDTNRTLRGQVSNLHNRINQLAQSLSDLAKKSFNSYDY